jgi:predicted Zn-dependent peptidase
VFEGEGFSSILIGGESRNPEEVYSLIKEEINNLKKNGISSQDYELSKKSVYGSALTSFNSADSIGNNLIDAHFTGREIFNYVDEIYNLTFDDVKNKFQVMFDCENSALSVIR